MTTIKTGFNATSLMKGILTKHITPLDIAKINECSIMSVHRANFVDNASPISGLLNLADGVSKFTQTISDRQPTLQYDNVLGRDTGYYTEESSVGDTLTYEGVIDIAGGFSMLAVVKITDESYQGVFGSDGAGLESTRFGIRYRENGKFQCFMGNVSSSPSIVGGYIYGSWRVVLMSHDGVNTMRYQILGESLGTNVAAPFTVVDPELRIGSATLDLVDANIDMCALFNTDILDPADTTVLDEVKSMLSSFYGSAVHGV